jgi:hypothetical protein
MAADIDRILEAFAWDRMDRVFANLLPRTPKHISTAAA